MKQNILDIPLYELSGNPMMIAGILGRFLPADAADSLLQVPNLRQESLRQLSEHRPDLIPPEKLDMIVSAIQYVQQMEESGQTIEAQDVEKPDGNRPVIVCMGDSITYGAGVEESRKTDCWVYILNTKLGGQYQVLNFGFSGATLQKEGDLSYHSTSLLKEAEQTLPEIVTIMFGTNDSKKQNWNKNRFQAEYDTFVHDILLWQSVKKVLLLVPPFAVAIEGETEIAAGIRNEIIRDQIRPVIHECANRYGLPCIDLYDATENNPEYFADGVHPNITGNQVIADIICTFVKQSCDEPKGKA